MTKTPLHLQPEELLRHRSWLRRLAGELVSDPVFYEFENVRAVRTGEWKYIERIYQKPNEMYRLESPDRMVSYFVREDQQIGPEGLFVFARQQL